MEATVGILGYTVRETEVTVSPRNFFKTGVAVLVKMEIFGVSVYTRLKLSSANFLEHVNSYIKMDFETTISI